MPAPEDVAADVSRPGYNPARHGIVHLGVGASHKVHQAVDADGAIAADGGDWRIVGVDLRSADSAEPLNPQNGLYSLVYGVKGT